MTMFKSDVSDLKYHPLPDFNMFSESQCIIDANQEDFLNQLVVKINNLREYENKSIVNDKIKEVIPEVAFYVVQYFIAKFTRPNTLNIMTYYIDIDDTIHFIPNNSVSIDLLAEEIYNYIVDTISNSGVFTQYWEDFTPFIKIAIDRSPYQMITDNRKDFEHQFEVNHDDAFILKLLESNLKKYEKERDVLMATASTTQPHVVRLAEVKELIKDIGFAIDKHKENIQKQQIINEKREQRAMKKLTQQQQAQEGQQGQPQPQPQPKQGQPQSQPQPQPHPQPQPQNKLPSEPKLKPVAQESYSSINSTKQKDSECNIA